VIVPAVKLPLSSRATIADAVFASVAVVAELLTLPEVAIVANLVSAIAADVLMSALTISPSFILSEVTASAANLADVTAASLIFTVVIALSEITGAVADEFVPAKSPANCTLPVADVVASGAPADKLLVTKAVVAICVLLSPEVGVGAVGVPVKAGEANGAFKANPGTVGKSAVPPKSPANFTLPFTVVVASGVALLATNVSTAATLGYNVVEPVFEAIFEVKFAVVCAPVTSATGIEVTAVIGLTPFPLTYPVKVDAPVPPLVTVITSPIFAFVTAPFAILFVTIPKSFTLKGDIVFDPTMGSGTTAKACYELNRRFIGFEIDPEYCEIARKRLKQKVITGFFGTQANSTSSSFNKDLTAMQQVASPKCPSDTSLNPDN
jgi:hypothetical protein